MIDELNRELQELESYASEANSGMTAFQIERFVVNSEPPSGRYACCCVEIKARLGAAKAIAREIESCQDHVKLQALTYRINDALREARVFRELADRWKHAMGGRTFEEIQSEYWDERLGRELCLRLVTGQPYGDLVKPIMALDNPSRSKLLLLNCRHAPANTEEVHFTLQEIEDGKWLLPAPEITDTK